jgi:hypothetical protein
MVERFVRTGYQLPGECEYAVQNAPASLLFPKGRISGRALSGIQPVFAIAGCVLWDYLAVWENDSTRIH